MLGTLDKTHKKAEVIGGGISGLLMTERLSTLGYEVTLHEAADRLGGLIQTHKTPYGLAETAAHSFRASEEVRALAEAIDLQLVATKTKEKYIFRHNTYKKIPLRFNELLTAFIRGTTVPSDGSKKTLAEFASHHLGDAAVDYIFTPMTNGIYGCSPHELEVPTAFASLDVPKGKSLVRHMLHQKKVNKGKPKAVMSAPAGGMQQLVDQLATTCESRDNVTIKLGSVVSNIPDAPNVVITTPANITAELLDKEPGLSESLRNIYYTPLMIATVFVEHDDIVRYHPGLGVLIPPTEGHDIMGMLCNSMTFSNRVKDDSLQSFTVFMGGTLRPEQLDLSDNEVKQLVQDEFRRLLGLVGEIKHLEVVRWPMGIPLYNSELRKSWNMAKKTWCKGKGRVLFGNWTGQVSLKGLIETTQRLS